jgi:alcohol dehydrogenase
MLAYVLRRYGRPEGSSLMQVPAPQPGSRQLLVGVRAAGLTPVGFKTRMGDVRLRLVQPYIGCRWCSATNWLAR